MQRNFISYFIAGLLGICASAFPAAASDDRGAPGTAQAFKKMLDCRSIQDGTSRLACFDAEVAALEKARDTQDIVIVDRKQITKARKSQFGLGTADLGLFGANSPEADQQEGLGFIATTLSSVRQGPDGKWIFVLEGGARWSQTEMKSIRTPKAGESIRIRKTALGGFMANINDRAAIRVKRLN